MVMWRAVFNSSLTVSYWNARSDQVLYGPAFANGSDTRHASPRWHKSTVTSQTKVTLSTLIFLQPVVKERKAFGHASYLCHTSRACNELLIGHIPISLKQIIFAQRQMTWLGYSMTTRSRFEFLWKLVWLDFDTSNVNPRNYINA